MGNGEENKTDKRYNERDMRRESEKEKKKE